MGGGKRGAVGGRPAPLNASRPGMPRMAAFVPPEWVARMRGMIRLLVLLPLAGCVVVQPVSVPIPVTPVCGDPVAGAAYGAAIGAGVGAVAGSFSADAGSGAAIGAGVGALAGLAAGSQPCQP